MEYSFRHTYVFYYELHAFWVISSNYLYSHVLISRTLTCAFTMKLQSCTHRSFKAIKSTKKSDCAPITLLALNSSLPVYLSKRFNRGSSRPNGRRLLHLQKNASVVTRVGTSPRSPTHRSKRKSQSNILKARLSDVTAERLRVCLAYSLRLHIHVQQFGIM